MSIFNILMPVVCVIVFIVTAILIVTDPLTKIKCIDSFTYELRNDIWVKSHRSASCINANEVRCGK